VTSENAEGGRAEWLTVGEAARRLGVSRWTVRRMVDTGELRGVDVRHMLRVENQSIDDYIEQHPHNGK
jgi:excisionase family DNA binding protein